MTTTYNDIHAVLAEMERNPSTFARLDFGGLTASGSLRQDVRTVLREAGGSHESMFTIRMAGTGVQLLGPLRWLAEMADEG